MCVQLSIYVHNIIFIVVVLYRNTQFIILLIMKWHVAEKSYYDACEMLGDVYTHFNYIYLCQKLNHRLQTKSLFIFRRYPETHEVSVTQLI